MTDGSDPSERRLAERFEAYLHHEIHTADVAEVVRRAVSPPPPVRRGRRWGTAAVLATVVIASIFTATVLRLILVASTPTSMPLTSSVPGSPFRPVPSAADAIGAFSGGGLWVRSGGVLYTSSDGGISWQNGSVDPDAAAVFVLDGQHWWTVGVGPGSTGNTGDPAHDVLHFLVRRTTDGGSTWTSSAIPGSYPETGPALTFADPERGFLLLAPERFSQSDGIVFTTTDGGTSWAEVAARGPRDLAFARLLSASPDGELVAGAEPTASGAGDWPLLQISNDGGATWRQVSLPGRAGLANGDFLLGPPAIVGATIVVAVGGEEALHFYRSSDQGKTWRASTPVAADGPSYGFPAVLNATHWLVPGGTGTDIWSTDDGGMSWRRAPAPSLPAVGPIAALAFQDAQHGLVLVSLGNTPAPKALYRTDDGADSWQPVRLSRRGDLMSEGATQN